MFTESTITSLRAAIIFSPLSERYPRCALFRYYRDGLEFRGITSTSGKINLILAQPSLVLQRCEPCPKKLEILQAV